MSTLPEQGFLFDPGDEEYEEARLLAVEENLMQSFRSVNTIKAYKCSWGTFQRWCKMTRREALPTSPDTLRRFIVSCLDPKRVPAQKLRTVKCHVAAIVAKHADRDLPSPMNGQVRKLLRSSARSLQQKPVKKAALQPEQVRRMSEFLRLREGPRSIGMRAARDRAILLIGFNAGWRRSELASLTTDDISFHPQGIGIRLAAASKTDQAAEKHRLIGIKKLDDDLVCPVQALNEWLAIRGTWSGPLFNPIRGNGQILTKAIVGETVNDILKLALERIGVDPKTYGGHSLRSGMITAAARNGATIPAIMDRSGHASLQVLMGYIREEQLFASDPLHGVMG